MTEMITGDQVVAVMKRVADRLIELRDQLNQLDAAMGDGDTGVSVAKGGAALRDYVATATPGDDLGRFLAGAGLAFNRAAPSTMGTLIATALMRAGKEARGRAVLDTRALADMVRAMDEGVQERGKAKPGDKTVVDALHPATDAFVQAIEHGHEMRRAAVAMLEAAQAGRDAAIGMRSKIGRGSWVGERSLGEPDAGTVLVVQVLETVLRADPSEPGSTLA